MLLLSPPSMAKFVVEKNSLTVTSPDNIKGTHDSAIGNFGIPQYGGSMAGNVVYPKDNQNGCTEFDEYGISFKSKPGALPTVVLVDRGSKILLFPLFSRLILRFQVLLLVILGCNFFHGFEVFRFACWPVWFLGLSYYFFMYLWRE